MLQHLRPLLKDTVIYALGNISGKVVGFILLPFYVEKLSATEYGMLGTMEATFQLIVALAGLNLHVAFSRWYWDKEVSGRQKSTFFTTLVSIVSLSLIVFVGLYPLARTISGLLLNTGDCTRLIRLVVTSAGLELISMAPATLCKMQRKPVMYTRNIIIRLAVVLVCTVTFVVFLNRKVEGIYEAQIVGAIVNLLLFLPYMLKNIVLKFEKSVLLKMLQFGFPLILSSSFGVVLGIADRYSLNFISGLESVGIYSLGYKLSNTLKIFIVMSVQLALTPAVFQMADQPGIKRFMSKIMTYFTFGLVFFVIGISLFGQEIVKILTIGKPDYWDAYLVIPFISFGIVFGMMKDTASYGLQIVKRTGIIASIIVFVSLLNVGLNILLIPFMGAVGAGLSTLLSQIIYFGAMLYYAQRYYPVSYEYKKVFLSIGTGILYCAIAYLIRDWGLGWRLCVKTALLGSYPFVLYLFRFYDRSELQALKGFWKKWRRPGDWKDHIRTLKF
jgi:O-antigen/teichoic acid export membrane protein